MFLRRPTDRISGVVKRVADKRWTTYKDFSFADLVFICFFTNTLELGKIEPYLDLAIELRLPDVLDTARTAELDESESLIEKWKKDLREAREKGERLWEEKANKTRNYFDFVSDWPKVFRCLVGHQQQEFILEGSIHESTRHLSDSTQRKELVESLSRSLISLRDLHNPSTAQVIEEPGPIGDQLSNNMGIITDVAATPTPERDIEPEGDRLPPLDRDVDEHCKGIKRELQVYASEHFQDHLKIKIEHMNDLTALDLYNNVFSQTGSHINPVETLRSVANMWYNEPLSTLTQVENSLGLGRTSRLVIDVPRTGDLSMLVNLPRWMLGYLVQCCLPLHQS